MHATAESAETALRTSHHPALRLSELVALISDVIDRSLTAQKLRTILEDYPERFRILESWHGPWRVTGHGVREGTDDAWVVAIADPSSPPDAPRTALRLRESVRWLGRGIDERSRVEIGRWYAIALAERATREAVVRRAA